ncbi:hypothetical protein ITP53_01780 [Nonomuraea sp. K274]|uniref:Uncharacterized protein n=1 Tax=Nonomuraea cypriaca TaxID=1187855 RepID=A0A931A475_9ACTN|nr:hypothetical protein [Nonomuraea cypriaca]MBF8184494.1 hypothetical protein [Nonomuraea cypriaca]
MRPAKATGSMLDDRGHRWTRVFAGPTGCATEAREVVIGRRKQNDDHRLLKAMERIAFYVFNGHNP